jgi:hypothetical protein
MKHAEREKKIKQEFTVSNVNLYLIVKLDTNYNNLQHDFTFFVLCIIIVLSVNNRYLSALT